MRRELAQAVIHSCHHCINAVLEKPWQRGEPREPDAGGQGGWRRCARRCWRRWRSSCRPRCSCSTALAAWPPGGAPVQPPSRISWRSSTCKASHCVPGGIIAWLSCCCDMLRKCGQCMQLVYLHIAWPGASGACIDCRHVMCEWACFSEAQQVSYQIEAV